MLKSFKQTPGWVISSVFFALILVFLALYIRGLDMDKLRTFSINWQLFGFATLLGLLFRYLGAYIWRVILCNLGASQLPSYAVTNDVYAKAWMGRYIPGTVTWIAGKVYMASHWGISKSRLTVASLLEGGVQVLAMTFVAFLLLGFDPRLDVLSPSAKALFVILGLSVLIILVPRVFNAFIMLAYRVARRKAVPHELQINAPAVIKSFVLYAAGTFVSGASCYFAIAAIAPDLDVHDYWYVVGSFALASVAGMAAPFAPSGIGIRDGIQLLLLTAILPKELALAATILVRLWSVAVDILFFAITRLAAVLRN